VVGSKRPPQRTLAQLRLKGGGTRLARLLLSRAVLLSFIPPMTPALVDEPPEGDGWLHEIKYDGYRTQLVLEPGRGYDWSDRYRHILDAAADLKCGNAIIDGEAIVQDEQGRSDFSAFQEALRSRPEKLVFMAFDLLYLNGDDLRPLPLYERRAALVDLVGCHDPSCCIQYSEHVSGAGNSLFEAADRIGLEGIVSKRATSRYRSGPSRNWLKVKCVARGEFIVIGAQPRDQGPPCALLARETEQGLEYAGSAFVTLAGAERDKFWRQMERLRAPQPAVPMSKLSKASWVRPELRVRAKYLKGSDKLRHASLLGLLN
jgi:bifunctional non-homologous end joining protein LigD